MPPLPSPSVNVTATRHWPYVIDEDALSVSQWVIYKRLDVMMEYMQRIDQRLDNLQDDLAEIVRMKSVGSDDETDESGGYSAQKAVDVLKESFANELLQYFETFIGRYQKKPILTPTAVASTDAKFFFEELAEKLQSLDQDHEALQYLELLSDNLRTNMYVFLGMEMKKKNEA